MGFPGAAGRALFDVAALAWQALPAPPAQGGLVQTSDRYGHGQAVLNGTAFVFGGYFGEYHNDLLTLKLGGAAAQWAAVCLLYTSPSPRDS